MKSSAHIDYAKGSKFFNMTDYDSLKKDAEAAEKSKKHIVWLQEYSKKVVTIVFIFYIISSIVSLGLVVLSAQLTGAIVGIETWIMEINQTFREVIGGYIIKSATENAFKIAGNYLVGMYDAKLNLLMMQHNKDINNNEEENEPTTDDENLNGDYHYTDEEIAG